MLFILPTRHCTYYLRAQFGHKSIVIFYHRIPTLLTTYPKWPINPKDGGLTPKKNLLYVNCIYEECEQGKLASDHFCECTPMWSSNLTYFTRCTERSPVILSSVTFDNKSSRITKLYFRLEVLYSWVWIEWASLEKTDRENHRETAHSRSNDNLVGWKETYAFQVTFTQSAGGGGSLRLIQILGPLQIVNIRRRKQYWLQIWSVPDLKWDI